MIIRVSIIFFLFFNAISFSQTKLQGTYDYEHPRNFGFDRFIFTKTGKCEYFAFTDSRDEYGIGKYQFREDSLIVTFDSTKVPLDTAKSYFRITDSSKSKTGDIVFDILGNRLQSTIISFKSHKVTTDSRGRAKLTIPKFDLPGVLKCTDLGYLKCEILVSDSLDETIDIFLAKALPDMKYYQKGDTKAFRFKNIDEDTFGLKYEFGWLIYKKKEE